MVNFTPGPSELYFTVADHLRRAIREGVPSISHRGKIFEGIFRTATDGLKELLELPPGYHIAFAGSATEIWERSIQSLVQTTSFHAVNGAFSSRFCEISKQLGKRTTAQRADEGSGFLSLEIPAGQELIALTHNETSTGACLPDSLFSAVRSSHPDALIVVDAVSSLPYANFDYKLIDSVFFSVQKGFGLPAGLGVWIYNDRCVEKTKSLMASGMQVGTYHSLLSLHQFASKYQTPETPNVLAIYLLGKVVEDFLRRGLVTIRQETEYKAALFYHTLIHHPEFKPFVEDSLFRSNTVITLSGKERLQELAKHLESKGLKPGDGYGAQKSAQLRFANFPAHSKESYEMLADALTKF